MSVDKVSRRHMLSAGRTDPRTKPVKRDGSDNQDAGSYRPLVEYASRVTDSRRYRVLSFLRGPRNIYFENRVRVVNDPCSPALSPLYIYSHANEYHINGPFARQPA